MKKTLWTRNYTLLMLSTLLGCVGGITGGYALSLLVFDETKSTMASAIVLAIQIVPDFLLPIFIAPWMDRMPRKPFLVGGDALNGLLYVGAGVYLLLCRFSYLGYLCFSLLLATLSAFDQLAYNSIYPKLIPQGMEQKGYAVSGMLYPIVQVVMMPVAAALYDLLGVGTLLLLQGGLSLAAALLESRIRISEEKRLEGRRYTLRLWWQDLCEVGRYFKKEKGTACALRLHGDYKRCCDGLRPDRHGLFPHGGGLQHGDVFVFLGRGVCRTDACGSAAIHGQNSGQAPLRHDLRRVSGL